MAETKKDDVVPEALAKLISESGILRPHLKVADLMSTTLKATALTKGSKTGGVTADGSGDVFIHSGYVYVHLHN